jgi:hypothetical protein
LRERHKQRDFHDMSHWYHLRLLEHGSPGFTLEINDSLGTPCSYEHGAGLRRLHNAAGS